MYDKLEITMFPAAILTTKVRKVSDFGTPVMRLAEAMIKIMDELNGVGIAANQVGVSAAVFIVKWKGKNSIFVNPTIVSTFGNKLSSEGCLSSPGRPATVRRPRKLVLSYQDVFGDFQELYVNDSQLAAIVMHEMDHLDGISILDYCSHRHCACMFARNRGGTVQVSDAMSLMDLGRKLGTGDIIKR